MKKNILIVSFVYPPNPSIGAKRISKISKGLYDLGWDVCVLTAEYYRKGDRANIEIPKKNIHYVKWFDLLTWTRTKEKDNNFKFFFKFVRSIPFFTSKFITQDIENNSWKKNAIKEGRNIVKNNNFDIIYSSFLPTSSMIIANYLSKRTRIPWINEYRDLWTHNPYLEYYFKRLSYNLNKAVESYYINQASALVTVSNQLKEDLVALYDKPTYTIYNGYDKLDMISVKEKGNYTILYTGSIYPEKRDPKILFIALNILKEKNFIYFNKIKIKFYGPIMKKRLQLLVNEFKLNENVELHESISRNLVIEKQRNSSLLLLLGWDNVKEKGVATGKLFEYLERKKKILAITYKKGVVNEILSSTKAGIVLTEPNEISAFLEKEVTSHFKKGENIRLDNANSLKKYSRKTQNQKLDHILQKYCT
jgi:Glycosyltransferase Family 4